MCSLAMAANGADPAGPVFGFLLDRDACPGGTCLHPVLSLRPRLGEFPDNMETAAQKSLAKSDLHRVADHLSGLLLVMADFMHFVFEYVYPLAIFLDRNPASSFAIGARGDHTISTDHDTCRFGRHFHRVYSRPSCHRARMLVNDE